MESHAIVLAADVGGTKTSFMAMRVNPAAKSEREKVYEI